MSENTPAQSVAPGNFIAGRRSVHARGGRLKHGLNIDLSISVKLLTCLVLSCNLGFTGALFSAEAADSAGAAAEKETTIGEVMQKALTAYGGKAPLAQMVSCYSSNGRKSEPGDAAQPFRHMHKGNRWRTDVEMAQNGGQNPDGETGQKKTETSAYDGASGWSSNGASIIDLSGDRISFFNDQEERNPWLLSYWQDPDYTFALKGRTTYRQIPVYSIEVTGKDGRTTTLFLDQNNYLVVGLSYQSEIPEKESAARVAAKVANVAVDFGEYRPVGGTMIPHKVIRSINNAEVESIELSSVVPGADIDDSTFYRPSPGTAWHIPRAVSIPFDYADKEIVVKGRLNGSEELNFLFDTGASETIIDRRVAAEHFLAKQGQYQIAGIAGYVSTETSAVKKFEIGNLILNDVQVRILDLSSQSRTLGKRIAGIIGTNVISKFVSVIDYAKPSITIGDIDSFERPAKAASVPFVHKSAPFVHINLNGKDEQTLLVDTGAAFNHLPSGVAQRFVPSDVSMRHVTQGTGLDGRPLQLGKVVIDTVTVGTLPIKKVAFTYPIAPEAPKNSRVSSASKEHAGFFSDSTLGILGNPFWENFIVTIDYKYERLLLQMNPIVRIRDDITQALVSGDNDLVLRREYRGSEMNYQKALIMAERANDSRDQAALLGRLGNLRRIMAKDLQRPEHASAAYNYFTRAQDLAARIKAPDVEGRILADWSLLYSDNGQAPSAKATMDRALMLAPQDPNVNVDCAVHLYRAHLYPEMQRYVEKALFLEPSNWQALWYQVKLSENFYDTPKVVATLKEILRFYPWSKVASDKLRSLNMGGDSTPKPKPAVK